MTTLRRLMLIVSLGLVGSGLLFAHARGDVEEPIRYRTLDRMIKRFAAEARTHVDLTASRL